MVSSVHSDDRGSLGVFEFKNLPFEPVRFFWIFETPTGRERAGHAHKECSQFIFSQQGQIDLHVINPFGESSRKKLLPGESFYLPPMHWLDLVDFSENAVLGVFASHPYDRGEYIDLKDEFEKLSNAT